MSFSAVWTDEAAVIYEDLRAKAVSALESRKNYKKKKSSRQEGLFKQLKKCVGLLLENPRHPGLNTHEFKSLSNPYNEKEKVLEIIKDRLIAGEDVLISEFGKCTVRFKYARRGRNPQTGEELILDARRVVSWKFSPVLRRAVDGSGAKREEI
jgi:nucleoid DNA-binding protein